MDEPEEFREALADVPPGAWAVAVSGVADSVALLILLRHHRPELALHVAHLDHQTRDGESARDAQFVTELAARFGLPITVRPRRSPQPACPSSARSSPSTPWPACSWLTTPTIKPRPFCNASRAAHPPAP